VLIRIARRFAEALAVTTSHLLHLHPAAAKAADALSRRARLKLRLGLKLVPPQLADLPTQAHVVLGPPQDLAPGGHPALTLMATRRADQAMLASALRVLAPLAPELPRRSNFATSSSRAPAEMEQAASGSMARLPLRLRPKLNLEPSLLPRLPPRQRLRSRETPRDEPGPKGCHYPTH
jgi:hypothetical protein